jgi:hypothetical protein
MDQLLKEAELFSDLTTSFTLVDAIVVMVLSFVSALIIGLVYKQVHRGVSYSQSYVQTLVMMEVAIAVIMLIVGSNIARAFSLVGALSIVRFRTALKDPKDLGFIFFAMAAGMAFGTRFLLLGGLFTVVQCLYILIMHYTEFGAKKTIDKVLKVHIQKDISRDVFERQLEQITKAFYLVSVDSVDDTLIEMVYIIEPKPKLTTVDIIDSIHGINQGAKVFVIEGEQKVDL